jgi:hypothetical protein
MRQSFITEWPEIGIAVEAEPLDFNLQYYDYFLDNLPIKVIQSHGAVAGKNLYTFTLRLSKFPPCRYMDLKAENLSLEPIGRVSIFITAGKVGSIMFKYGDIPEPMSYPTFAQVKAKDIDKLIKAGEAAWNSIYRTKQIISAIFKKR